MMPIIKTEKLIKKFRADKGFFWQQPKYLTAVDQVSLSINSGDTLGLVGESGSGKSTVGNCILRLLQATSGSVLYKGEEILSKNEREFRKLRGKLQIVFQDPQSSLDPRMTVEKIVGNPLRIQQGIKGSLLADRVYRL